MLGFFKLNFMQTEPNFLNRADISAPLITRPGVARAGIQLGGLASLIRDPKPTSFTAL